MANFIDRERYNGRPEYGPQSSDSSALVSSDTERGPDLSMTAEFEVDHLASFTGAPGGIHELDADVGVARVRKLDADVGLWSMKCIMYIVSNGPIKEIVIQDKQTQDELERFSFDLIHNPTYRESTDSKEVYNNLVLFVVASGPDAGLDGTPPPELHAFQATHVRASLIVETISQAMGIQRPEPPRNGHSRLVPPTSAASFPVSTASIDRSGTPKSVTTESYTGWEQQQQPSTSRPLTIPPVVLTGPDNTDALLGGVDYGVGDREIYLINRCFDDIERFVGRLQMAVQAYKELKRPTGDRGSHSSGSVKSKKKSKKQRKLGDGVLSMRARLPPGDDFVDCLKKVKLALIIIGRLHGKAHNPNPVELVHCLFVPLSIVVDSSRDQHTHEPELARNIISPLLTREVVTLLQCSLNSREEELWHDLGDGWTVPRDEWQGYVPPYVPRFSDGYQPSLGDFNEELFINTTSSQLSGARRYATEVYPSIRSYPRTPNSTAPRMGRPGAQNQWYKPAVMSAFQPRETLLYQGSSTPQLHSNHLGQQDTHLQASTSTPEISLRKPWETRQLQFAEEVLARGGRVCEVVYEKVGQNRHELTVQQGDLLELVDDSRNWWRLRNCLGEEGHCMHTILRMFDVRAFEQRVTMGPEFDMSRTSDARVPMANEFYRYN